jgi:photosystem II stability/assembly factor-like uncharacterized protein
MATLYVATDGGVYLTENSRAALATGPRAACLPRTNRVRWRPLHGGLQTTQFYTGAVLPGGGAFFGGKQDNGTMRGTLANGAEWERLFGGDGAAVAVDPRDANTIFLSTPNSTLFRSRDGGLNYAQVTRGLNEPASNFAFIGPLGMDPSLPDRLYAGGRSFYRSENQGDLWERISRGLDPTEGQISAIAVAPSNSSRVLFATSTGYIFRSTNASESAPGTLWEGERPRPGYVPALTFDPNNADIAYAVYSQFNTAPEHNHVYRTTDGGRTWEGIDRTGDNGIPDIPVLAVTVDPQDSNRIYLGTDLGVFVSIDGGASWARDESPFASVPTEALRIDRGSGVTYLYAFTFGRGVWRTRLPGAGTPCSYSLRSDVPPAAPAFGGEVSMSVDTQEGCVWTGVGRGAQVQSPPTGTGAGSFRVTLPLNTATTARNLAVTLQDQAITTRQNGALVFPASADAFESAHLVPALPYVGIRDTRTNTSAETDPQPSCFPNPPAKTAWLRVDAPESGRLEVLLQGRRYDIFGNSGVVVSAYAGSPTGLGPEVACGAVARDLQSWRFGSLSFDVTAGVTYYLQVGATGVAAQDGGYTIIGIQLRR